MEETEKTIHDKSIEYIEKIRELQDANDRLLCRAEAAETELPLRRSTMFSALNLALS